jgi:hypothetical protein
VEEGADVVVVVELVDEPDASDDDVDAPLVVEVVPSPVETETPPLEVVVEVEEAGRLEPGCSRATTTAITAVAPVAARTTPRVTPRRRDCALALLWGPCASDGRDIDHSPLLAEHRHPTMAASTPAPDALCTSCDIRTP